MALNLENLAPVETTMSPRKAPREAVANPFLTEGWMLRTYESGKAEEVTVPGAYIDGVRKDRKTGEETPIQKLTGDAAQVVNLIRYAADALGIGVRVEVVPAKRKGYMVVKYLGQERRQRKEKPAAE